MDREQTKYRKALEHSLRIAFRIEDVLPEDAHFDLTRPLLPEALAQVQGLDVLSRSEQRLLNQIRGHSYLRLFGIVEEFILPFITDHARARLTADDYEVRALLQFAGEEAKHIHLFRRFATRFTEDFGIACPMIGPVDEIVKAVLAHHPLGVGLMILHIEWMTQQHYRDAVRHEQGLEPLFASLLKHHWLEESQHAQIDALIVAQLAAQCSDEDIAAALADYHRIVALLEAGLCAQVKLDLDVLEARTGRSLMFAQRDEVRKVQERAYRYTFIESGFEHPRFREVYSTLARRAAAANPNAQAS